MNTRKLTLIFILTGLISASLLLFLSNKIYPYSPDGAAYIQAARSLKEGRGLMVPVYGLNPIEADAQPLILWPPGYPLLICTLSLFNIEESIAARLIPGFIFLLLPYTFFSVLRHIMKDSVALVAAIICSFTSLTITRCLQVNSDIPFLFAALTSMALLFKSIGKDKFWYGLFSGIFAGIALAIRNVGYTIPISVLAGLFISLFFKLISKSRYSRSFLSYIFGFFLSYAPQLLRNIIVFNTINPYNMGLPRYTYFEMIKAFPAALTTTFFSHHPPSLKICILFSFFLIFMTILYVIKDSPDSVKKNSRVTKICLNILIIYVLVGSLVIIIFAKTIYSLQEINRYLLQYNWFFLSCVIAAMALFYERFKRFFKLRARWYVIFLIVLFLAQQFRILGKTIKDEKPYLEVFNNLKTISFYISNLPDESYIISNKASDLQILTKKNVHKFHKNLNISPEELAKKVTKIRPLVVVLAGSKMHNSLPKNWLSAYSGVIPEGYSCVHQDKDVVVLFHDKESKLVDNKHI
ncbi:MAG: glycosyltransferase family 39 protein [Candidatus Omnitrophica bacterium]|nr:glycosyltransferase family 39 protein [Candidatus Omnitrophota bacterium]